MSHPPRDTAKPPLPRVLDVGNCDADHGRIRQFLTTNFECDIDRVMFVDEARARLAAQTYALVLVNRLIFADATPGLPLVDLVQGLPAERRPAVMLISNYDDAQAEAVARGAMPGFGKAALGTPDAVARLATVLPTRMTRRA